MLTGQMGEDGKKGSVPILCDVPVCFPGLCLFFVKVTVLDA